MLTLEIEVLFEEIRKCKDFRITLCCFCLQLNNNVVECMHQYDLNEVNVELLYNLLTTFYANSKHIFKAVPDRTIGNHLHD